jgi:hypothetical protein
VVVFPKACNVEVTFSFSVFGNLGTWHRDPGLPEIYLFTLGFEKL